MSKYCDLKLQQRYLKDLYLRHQTEVESCLSFVKDYIALQRELVQAKKAKPQVGLSQGDLNELRHAREEVDFLRAKVGNQELGQVSRQLEGTEQAAVQQDKLREIQRRNLALEKRCNEVEYLLEQRDQEKLDHESQIRSLKEEKAQLGNLLFQTDEKCKQLQQDNQDYVRQLIEMKEKMGNTINDLLAGGADSVKISKAKEQANNIELVIKPQYLKGVLSNTQPMECPQQISWKTCAHKIETTCLTFNRDGNIIYTGGADGIVKGWRVSDGKELCQMTGLQKSITSVAASLDNEYVLASSLDQNKMVLYRTKTNNKLMQYVGHADTINACLFNFSQKQCISGSDDRTVRYWDVLTAKCERSVSCPNQINNLDLSLSEQYLASAHMNDVRIWSVKHGKVMTTIDNAHLDAVTCVKFTPDEMMLISTGKDNLVKLWDVRTWKQVGSSFENSSYACPSSGGVRNKSDFCISPNGQYVVLGSSSGAVLVLDLKSGVLQVEEIYDDEHVSAVVGCAWLPQTSVSGFATIDRAGSLFVWKD